MRYVRLAAFLFMLVFVAYMAVGCSEESTAPDNKPPTAAGSHIWSKRFGDGDMQLGRAVAVDASGNVILAGYFVGTVDFGGGALTSAGNEDIYVAKFGPSGTHLWSKRFGDGGSQLGQAVAVDASGNVILAGYFVGTVDFGGGALINSGVTMDIYVAKFGPDGSPLWSKRFGDASVQFANAVAVDASGNIIVAGGFRGTVDFGGGELTSTYLDDIFIAKFGPDGSHIWSKRFGDGNAQDAYAVAVDASGNAVVTGNFDGSVNFGGSSFVSDGMNDIFVAKFEPNGAHLWSKRFGSVWDEYSSDITADASGNIFVVGGFYGAIDFGGGTLASKGGSDLYIAELDSDGTHLWSKSFGDVESQGASAVAVDASGNVVVAGRLSGAVDFGGGALTGAGDRDIFVAKFGSDGAHVWSKCFGDGADQFVSAVAVDASGNVIVAGYFYGVVDFGGGALASAGHIDIFIAKFGR